MKTYEKIDVAKTIFDIAYNMEFDGDECSSSLLICCCCCEWISIICMLLDSFFSLSSICCIHIYYNYYCVKSTERF